MIKGKKRIELSAQEILNRISYYDIYRKYVGNFKINESICNPFRKDHTPSFVVGNKYGELIHTDFADAYWRGNAIQLVEQIHNCSFDQALHIIDKDFGLGIASGELNEDYKKITSQYKQPEAAGKRYSLIQVVTRKFTNEELSYWAQYHQTEDDLRENHIYSIKEVYLNRRRYPIGDDIRFGYLYEGGYWKIYRPYADKRKKWMSNVPICMSYGLENLSKKKNTLITKSMKDFLVCKKVYPHTMHVQNESIAAFSQDTIRHIQNNSREVFYAGDSDEVGKKVSYVVTDTFGWRHINTPDRLLPSVNDFADWSKQEGLEVIREHFIKKKLIV